MNSTSGGNAGAPGSSPLESALFEPEASPAAEAALSPPSQGQPPAPAMDPDDAVPTLKLPNEGEEGGAPAAKLWPGTVPSAEVAQALLQDPEVAGALGEVCRALLAEASEPEKMLLVTDDVPDELRLLKAALLQRWRLAAANALAPAPTGAKPAVDRAAFDALLAETDALLQSLGATQGLSEAMRQSVSSARSHLARELVSLTERVPIEGVVPDAPAAPAAAPGAFAAKTARSSNTRLVSIEKGSAARPRRMGALQWALVAALVLGGAFHGVRFALRAGPAPRETPAGWPEGTVHMRPQQGAAPGSDVYLVRPDRPVPESTLNSLRADAAARGEEVVQLNALTYVVRPVEKSKGAGK